MTFDAFENSAQIDAWHAQHDTETDGAGARAALFAKRWQTQSLSSEALNRGLQRMKSQVHVDKVQARPLLRRCLHSALYMSCGRVCASGGHFASHGSPACSCASAALLVLLWSFYRRLLSCYARFRLYVQEFLLQRIGELQIRSTHTYYCASGGGCPLQIVATRT